MTIDQLFTPESVEQMRRETAVTADKAPELLTQYRKNYEDQIGRAPCLSEWFAALEQGDLVSATNADLWSRLATEGFIHEQQGPLPDSHQAVFYLNFISPHLFHVFRSGAEVSVNYSFSTIKICMRRETVSPSLHVPEHLRDACLVDTELFEIPTGVSEDSFDDREKIHIVYLAGFVEGALTYRPVYIGIGSGEAYGTGPRKRSTRGRFRLYRYDVKDNFQLEYIKITEAPEYRRRNVCAVASLPEISGRRVTILLVKSTADKSFLSLSDPMVAEGHSDWLKANPRNEFVYKELTLEKKHYDLRGSDPNISFADVASALKHAWALQMVLCRMAASRSTK